MSESVAPSRFWGRSTVQTACPLDCPDSCSLSVTVERGKVIRIDGSTHAPSTAGYICGKVRRFDKRLYGEDRLLYPAVRKGQKVLARRNMGPHFFHAEIVDVRGDDVCLDYENGLEAEWTAVAALRTDC